LLAGSATGDENTHAGKIAFVSPHGSVGCRNDAVHLRHASYTNVASGEGARCGINDDNPTFA
jgi:hypothetical protein